MAKITLEDIEKVAKLAKLKFSDEELKVFYPQFEQIIEFVNKISEIDTTHIKPTTHAVEKQNEFRDDIVKEGLKQEDIEKIAPEYYNGNIIVPKVVEY